ncbi:unnamed protein product [Calicophoron daubneyi]|uniref:Uncharacterized protein n=1 Tax=Calicophoron daubneyi TaxID=300641 RepID=A0AAV2TMT0_CALDB
MPKYCVEFIADVHTLPSQDNSESSDCTFHLLSISRPTDGEQKEYIPSPVLIDKVHGKDKKDTELFKPIATELLSQISNSAYSGSENIQIIKTEGPNSENRATSHATHMGNSVCYKCDVTRTTENLSFQRPSSVCRYVSQPVHRTFVISRAVQCNERSFCEEIMCNNHNHYDSSPVVCGGIEKDVFKSRNNFSCQVHGSEPRNYTSCVFDALTEQPANRGLLGQMCALSKSGNMAGSNSELSIDVSSLSEKRCSSITPPGKPETHSPRRMEELHQADQPAPTFQDEEIDSLSPTISDRSSPNMREFCKKRKRRPAPYSRHNRRYPTTKCPDSSSGIRKSFRKGCLLRKSSSNLSFTGNSVLRNGLFSPDIGYQTSAGKSTALLDLCYLNHERSKPAVISKKENGYNVSVFDQRMTKRPNKSSMHGDFSETPVDTSSISSIDQPQPVSRHQYTNGPKEKMETVDMEETICREKERDTSSRVNSVLSISPEQANTSVRDTNDNARVNSTLPSPEEFLESVIPEPALKLKDKVDDSLESNYDPVRLKESHVASLFKSSVSQISSEASQKCEKRQPSAAQPTTSAKADKTSRSFIKFRSLSESRLPLFKTRKSTPNQCRQETPAKVIEDRLPQVSRGSPEVGREPIVETTKIAKADTRGAVSVSSETKRSSAHMDENSIQSKSAPSKDTQANCSVRSSSLGKPAKTRQSRSLQRPGLSAKSPRRRESHSAQPRVRNSELSTPRTSTNSIKSSGSKSTIPPPCSGDHNASSSSGQKNTTPPIKSCLTLTQSDLKPSESPQSKARLSDSSSANSRIITAPSRLLNHPSLTKPPKQIQVGRKQSNESASSAPVRTCTAVGRSRMRLVRHKFYIPESTNIEAILADPADRRIKAICERYKCDVEIYSKLPWCGFLQYIVVLTARDLATLRKCARTLDCRLNWCLDAQIR